MAQKSWKFQVDATKKLTGHWNFPQSPARWGMQFLAVVVGWLIYLFTMVVSHSYVSYVYLPKGIRILVKICGVPTDGSVHVPSRNIVEIREGWPLLPGPHTGYPKIKSQWGRKKNGWKRNRYQPVIVDSQMFVSIELEHLLGCVSPNKKEICP